MSATGYLQVHTYASYAQLPLENAAIAVTAADGTAIALRVTDSSGQIVPIEIPVPDLAESQAPDPGEKPFTNVNLYAHLAGFEPVEAEQLQIFAGVTTLQELEMVPLAEMPQAVGDTVVYDTPPQNL